MQYLLTDLIKLPLNDRLNIIETAICSLSTNDHINEDDKNKMVNKIKFWKATSKETLTENPESSIL